MHGRNATEAETPRPARADISEKTEYGFSQAGVEKTVEARRGSPKNEQAAQGMRKKLQQMEDELRRLEKGYPTSPQEKNERVREAFGHDTGEESAETEESAESEKSDEDSAGSINSEESSTSDSSEEKERKQKRKKKKKKVESEEETDWPGEKTEEREAPMRAFGEETSNNFEMAELSALLSNVVVDELQKGLKTAMASRIRIGSLSNLVKTIKEKMPVEVKRFKFQSKQRGHKVKHEVMEFMMKLVNQEHLNRALASMVVIRLWTEDDERY